MSFLVSGGLFGSAIPDSGIAQYVASSISASDGQTISSWSDSQGSNDLSGGSPTFKTGGLSGKPFVRFDGVDDALTTTFGSAEGQPNTIQVVGEIRATDSNQPFIDGISSGQLLYWVERGNNPNSWALFAGNSNVYGTQNDTASLFTGVFDGASSVLREDGTQTASGDPGSNSIDGISLGAYADQSAYGEVDIYEVVVYNDRLTGTEIDKQEQRLADKYGITI